MIHVEGWDVKCGKASGSKLIEEASCAVFAVYETLRNNDGKPEGVSDMDLMCFVLRQIGKNMAHMEAVKFKDSKEDPEELLKRVFGDLLDKEE